MCSWLERSLLRRVLLWVMWVCNCLRAVLRPRTEVRMCLRSVELYWDAGFRPSRPHVEEMGYRSFAFVLVCALSVDSCRFWVGSCSQDDCWLGTRPTHASMLCVFCDLRGYCSESVLLGSCSAAVGEFSASFPHGSLIVRRNAAT